MTHSQTSDESTAADVPNSSALQKVVAPVATVKDSLLDQYRTWLLTGITVLYFVCTGYISARRSFEYDELVTFHIARLPTVANIIQALLKGADNHPPLDYLIRHFSMQIFGASEFGARLPSMVGVWLACLSLYGFVSRRVGTIGGLIAFLTLIMTDGFGRAFYGRSYALTLGCAGLAALAWQTIADRKYRAHAALLLWSSLTCTLLLHYYGLLLLIPLVAGEAVRSRMDRKIDWWIWTPTLLALPAELLSVPFIASAKAYSAHFWTPITVRSLPDVYKILFENGIYALTGFLILLALQYLLTSSVRRDARVFQSRTVPAHDVAFLGACLLLIPVVLLVLAVFATKAFLPKYALIAVIGFCGLVGVFAGRSRPIQMIVLISVGVSALYIMVRTVYGFRNDEVENYTALMTKLAHSTTETIVSNEPSLFLLANHYGDAAMRKRLVLIVDPELSVLWTGKDTDDRAIIGLAPLLSARIVRFSDFVKTNHQFVVLPPFHWIGPQLMNMGGTRISVVQLPGGLTSWKVYIADPGTRQR